MTRACEVPGARLPLAAVALLTVAACGGDPGGGAPVADLSTRAAATIAIPNRYAPEQILDLPAEPTCDGCRIEIGEPFELVSNEADGAMPGGLGALERLSNGGFAAAFWGAAPIYVFDDDGSFVATIGVEGQGPGEFGTNGIGNGLFTRGPNIYAFDSRNNRLTVVDAASGEFVEEVQLRDHFNVLNAAFPADDRIVIAGRHAFGGLAGHPLHLLDGSGNWLLSFGSAEPYEASADGWTLQRYLASTGDGSFWAAPMRELVIEQWTIEGERLRAFSGQRDRFTPGERGNYTEEGRPVSRMYGLTIDDEGLLWLLYSVASVDWQDNLEVLSVEQARAERVQRFRPLPGRRIRDAFVEVVDPERGVVLARELLPEAYFSFVGPGMLVRGFDDPVSGNSRLEVVEVRLRR